MEATQPFRSYLTDYEGIPAYMAGLPGYPGNFSRDTILAGIISADQHLLDSQLRMSAQHQGTKYDPISGEEPGKVHHEFPGIPYREPLTTTYNACDTTGLYLIGLEFLRHLNKSESQSFLEDHRGSIESAVDYITSHIQDGLF